MASVHNSVLVVLLLLSIVAALATAIAAAEGSPEAVPQLVTLPVAWRAGPRPTWTLSEEQHADRVRRHARRRATATTTTSHDDGPEYVDVHNQMLEGYYWSYIEIGNPPQMFSVILDTGSSLTAVPGMDCTTCGNHMDPKYNPSASSTSEAVSCRSNSCPGKSCKHNQCFYLQSYAEGSRLEGYYWKDEFHIGTSLADAKHSIPFQFGAHSVETKLFVSQKADGIMGLSRQSNTIVTALHNAHKLPQYVFTLCLSQEGGQFVVGGVNASLHLAPAVYTDLLTGSFYKINMHSLSVGGKALQVSTSAWTARTGCIVDSGTTFTYVPHVAMAPLYDAITAACKEGCSQVQMAYEKACFKLDGGSAAISDFPILEAHLRGATIQIPPSLYLSKTTSADTFCVGIYDNGNDGTVIGANIMKGYDVIFDHTNARVGFAPSSCSAPYHECPSCAVRQSSSTTDEETEAVLMWVAIIAGSIMLVIAVGLVAGRCVHKISASSHWQLVQESDHDVELAATAAPNGSNSDSELSGDDATSDDGAGVVERGAAVGPVAPTVGEQDVALAAAAAAAEAEAVAAATAVEEQQREAAQAAQAAAAAETPPAAAK